MGTAVYLHGFANGGLKDEEEGARGVVHVDGHQAGVHLQAAVGV